LRLAASPKADPQGAALNVYLINSLGRPNGISLPRVFTNRMALEYFPDGNGNPFPGVTGFALAHETGHFLGLVHRLIDNTNLMRPTPTIATGFVLTNRALKNHQVEEAQQVLGRNSESQRGVRAD